MKMILFDRFHIVDDTKDVKVSVTGPEATRVSTFAVKTLQETDSIRLSYVGNFNINITQRRARRKIHVRVFKRVAWSSHRGRQWFVPRGLLPA